jgi:hypothetical protein
LKVGSGGDLAMDIMSLDVDSFCRAILNGVESRTITSLEAIELIKEYWRLLK